MAAGVGIIHGRRVAPRKWFVVAFDSANCLAAIRSGLPGTRVSLDCCILYCHASETMVHETGNLEVWARSMELKGRLIESNCGAFPIE